MKAIWILFLLSLSPSGFSQDTLGTVLSHHWAAGQCCSGGTDITFNLFEKLAHLDFDSLAYVSSGLRVVVYPSDFRTQLIGQKTNCILTYGWSTNGYEEYNPSTLNVGYGLPASRFSSVSSQKTNLLVYRGNGVPEQAVVNEQFTVTAYP